MNNRRHFTIETLFKLGGLFHKVNAQLQDTFLITAAKYPHLTTEQMKDLQERFGPDAYINRLFELFDEHFTDEEIQQIQKFWSSKAGKKLCTGSYAQAEQKLALDWITELRKAIQEYELKKKV